MSQSSLWAAESTPSLAEVHRDVYAWMEKTNSTRKQLRSARSAVALRVAYDIPDVIRPHYTQRHRITDLLNHDPYRAYTDAKQQLYVVTGSAADIGQRDDRLMALWDDYTPEQLYRLLSSDHRVPGWIAQAGCADFLLPARKDHKALNGMAIHAAGSRDKATRHVIRQSVTTVLAVECGIDQLSHANHKRSRQQRLQDQRRYRHHATELFTAAAALKTALGTTADAVYETLFELATPFIHEYQFIDQYLQFADSAAS